MPTALITGGSRGLGKALATELDRTGWQVIITGRDQLTLEAAASRLSSRAVALAGDVANSEHRARLAQACGPRLDLLVNNASLLGPSPLQQLGEIELSEVRDVLEVNVLAPLALTSLLLPALELAGGTIVNLSSDAAVEAYPGWGAYGASKAALDQMSSVLAVENPDLAVYAFDPGDMRTDMHQAAFPLEDISDRPEPESVVPALISLLEDRPPSARYSASALMVQAH